MAYPTTLDSLAANKGDTTDAIAGTPTSGSAGDHAAHHNSLATAINAVETELGTLAKGLYAANVRERFEISSYKNQSCKFATTATLTATYSNGTAGVGATLTNASAAPTTDGITWVVGDRVLVKNQTTAFQNGIYTVTQITNPWILTRAIDADTSAKIADSKLLIDQGTANGDTEWYQSSTAPTMGTTALYFRRTQPIYSTGAPRSLWAPGSGPAVAQPIMETLPRQVAQAQWTVPVTTAQYLIGGLVCPAGRAVSNVNFVALNTAGTITIGWFALARQSDRLVMCHTANSTTVPTAGATTTRAFTAAWTPIEDTPVWLIFSWGNATTTMILPAAGGSAQSAATFNLLAPAMFATNGVTPTTTVPTDGTTTITAATAGVATSATVGFPYFWLT